MIRPSAELIGTVATKRTLVPADMLISVEEVAVGPRIFQFCPTTASGRPGEAISALIAGSVDRTSPRSKT